MEEKEGDGLDMTGSILKRGIGMGIEGRVDEFLNLVSEAGFLCQNGVNAIRLGTALNCHRVPGKDAQVPVQAVRVLAEGVEGAFLRGGWKYVAFAGALR